MMNSGHQKRGRSWDGGGPPSYMTPPPSKRGRYGNSQSGGGAVPQSSLLHPDYQAYQGDLSYTANYGYEEESWTEQPTSWGGFGGQTGRAEQRGARSGAAPAPQRGKFSQVTSTNRRASGYHNQSYSQAATYQDPTFGQGQGRGTAPPVKKPTTYQETYPNQYYTENSYAQDSFEGSNFGDNQEYYGKNKGQFRARKAKISDPFIRAHDSIVDHSGFGQQQGSYTSRGGRAPRGGFGDGGGYGANSGGSAGSAGRRGAASGRRGRGRRGSQGTFDPQSYEQFQEEHSLQFADARPPARSRAGRGFHGRGQSSLERGQPSFGHGEQASYGQTSFGYGDQESFDQTAFGYDDQDSHGAYGYDEQASYRQDPSSYGLGRGMRGRGQSALRGRNQIAFGNVMRGTGMRGGRVTGRATRGAPMGRGGMRGASMHGQPMRGGGSRGGSMRGGRAGMRGGIPSLLGYSAKARAIGSNIPMNERFKNLCRLVKVGPKFSSGASALETFLTDESVCLSPAYVFKGERRDDNHPFSFNCKVYVNNIFIGSGVATNKKDSKNRACENAMQVLAKTPALTILNTHEKVNVSALGKSDADIVECAVKSGESNIGNVLSVPDPGVKKSIADFYILEPERVDESTGMNSTCILRQSADFSHLLLKYEFTGSARGFLCTVNIEGNTLAKATAGQQNMAKNAASHIALQNLRENNWTIQIIKRDKPKPAETSITATLGHINADDVTTTRPAFEEKLKAHLSSYFSELQDATQWLSLSPDLNREERDAVYTVAKELNLRVETKRVDGGRGPVGENDSVFLVVSKKMSCQDLFDYIWEKSGETWRYKLKPPANLKLPATGNKVFQ